MNTVRPLLQHRSLRIVSSFTICFTLWLTSFSLVVVAKAPVNLNEGSQSRYHRTAQYVQGASPQLRGEFATIALTNLADTYIAEAEIARGEARSSGSHANLRGWSLAVNHFAHQIPFLLEDIELGLPVSFFMAGGNSLAVSVADRTVILSSPRLNRQNLFEQAILEEFCSRNSCQQFVSQDAVTEPIPVSSVYVRPDWKFTTQGAICSYEGITVHFQRQQNLTKARLICEQFLQEVMILTNEIAWQSGLAVPIEWNELEIQQAPRRPEHIIKLNRLGDTIVASIPLIYGSPKLLGHIVPWVRKWLVDPQEAAIELDAETYGWEET